MSVALHNFIEKCNILQKPTEAINDFFREHPTLHKVALIANHIFRAIAMTALMVFLPFSFPINLAICLAGSLFYRLTAETNCAYKFALPAMAGAMAFTIGQTSLNQIISGVAFASLGAFGLAAASILPLAAYVTYIALTVNYDVNKRL